MRAVDDRLSELAAELTTRQRREFASICKVLEALPKGALLVFWTTPKGSLSGDTPLDALTAGRYKAVRQAAEGFRER